MLRPCVNVIIDEYLSEGESDQYEAFMPQNRVQRKTPRF